MNRKELVEQIFAKKSFLCVGLDTDIKKVPEHLTKQNEKTEDIIFAFNKAIIDATAPYCVSYKPNLAFYVSWKSWLPLLLVNASRMTHFPSYSKNGFTESSPI